MKSWEGGRGGKGGRHPVRTTNLERESNQNMKTAKCCLIYSVNRLKYPFVLGNMALDAKYCGLKFITSLPHEVPLWTPFCLDLAMPADVRSTAASPLGRERPVTSNTFQTTIRQLSDNYKTTIRQLSDNYQTITFLQ